MTDELKKLQEAFNNEPEIKASKRAKDAALIAAINAYAAENPETRQGNAIDRRLKKQDNKLVDLFTFSKWRNSMKLSYLLPGTAGLAALVLVAVNTNQFARFYDAGKLSPMRESAPITLPEQGAIDTLAPRTEKSDLEAALPPTITRADSPAPISKSKQLRDNAEDERVMAVSKLAELKEEMSAASVRTQAVTESVAGKRLTVQKKMSYQAGNVAGSINLASTTACCDPEPLLQITPMQGRDKFDGVETNPLKLSIDEPVSTFSIDVDTASYSFMRASINRNLLPPKDAVRIEELINYFPYNYPGSENRQQPFSVNTTILPSPWNPDTRLLHIAIKGYDLAKSTSPKSNLVFLLDTSGSMNQANKLPLLQQSFKLLLSTLSPDDTVSIVAYAGSAGTILKPTKVQDKASILNALSRLSAGGSTAGGEGIRLAYQLVEANFDPAAVNRVILATDGDFNVGIRNPDELKSFIERKRNSGVFLSVLGFGMGNYNDALMQALAQNGNGNAAYIDSLSEARKVLVEEASSTLFTIAKDVKIQVEFNPEAVKEYRLIGYETRQLKREDFNNDKVDAGDIGSGHSVTAIYEITPTGSTGGLVDPLRYQKPAMTEQNQTQTEYGFLKLRYKLPDASASRLIEQPIRIADSFATVSATNNDVRFATAVAAYGQLLRGGRYTGAFDYDDVIELALNAKGQDPYGYRAEFINLVRLAKTAEAL